MSDISRLLGTRAIETGEARVLTISQVYDTTQEDLWEAVTTADRIRRWFLPVEGELKEGGRYQLEGNAGGTITRCDRPNGYAATWEFGGEVSWIEVRLSPEGPGRTRFELEQTAVVPEEFWNQFGPGATGIGFELGLNGLRLYLSMSTPGEGVDPAEFQAWTASPEGRAFIKDSSDGWVDAAVKAGEDPAASRARGNQVYAFYTGTEPVS